MENPLNLSLTQGKKFMYFQNKTKEATLYRKNIKEGFETQQNNIILPILNNENQVNSINNYDEKKMILKINKMEEKYKYLMTQYKQELQNIQNKINIDNSNIPIIAQDDKIILDNIKNQLNIIGNDIATNMEALYTKNKQIYKQMNMNSR